MNKNKKGCPYCSGHKHTKEIINNLLRSKNFYISDEYLGYDTITTIRCSFGHEWKSSPNNVINNSGCPSCSTYGFNISKSAYAYILKFPTFIKFGITNDIETRFRKHRSKNGEFEVVMKKLFENGKDALNWETKIKQDFGGRFVTKEQCPDGFTETLDLSLLNEVKSTL
jgi:hypothetical protein